MLQQKLFLVQDLEILKLRAHLLTIVKVQIDEKGDLSRYNSLSAIKIVKKKIQVC